MPNSHSGMGAIQRRSPTIDTGLVKTFKMLINNWLFKISGALFCSYCKTHWIFGGYILSHYLTKPYGR